MDELEQARLFLSGCFRRQASWDSTKFLWYMPGNPCSSAYGVFSETSAFVLISARDLGRERALVFDNQDAISLRLCGTEIR